MNFLSDKIDRYAVDHTQKEPELLQKLNKETWQKALVPRMLSGHYQGRILSMISKLVNPKKYIGNWYLHRLFSIVPGRRNAKKRNFTYH